MWPTGDPGAVDLGDDAVGLHRVLVHAGKQVVALDDDVRRREHGLHIAAIDAVPVADIALALGQGSQAMEVARSKRLVVDEGPAPASMASSRFATGVSSS